MPLAPSLLEVAAAVPVVPPSGGDGALYLAVLAAAVPSTVGPILSFVQWLGKRAVDREDKAQEELRSRLKEHEDRFGAGEKRFVEIDRAVAELRTEMRATSTGIEGLRASVQALQASMDARFEKQEATSREQLREHAATIGGRLEKLETDLRQEMGRAMADSLRARGERSRR